jgi:hypothetical protein
LAKVERFDTAPHDRLKADRLLISVHKKYLLFLSSKAYAEMHSGCCFTHATFLIGNGDHFDIDFSSFLVIKNGRNEPAENGHEKAATFLLTAIQIDLSILVNKIVLSYLEQDFLPPYDK